MSKPAALREQSDDQLELLLQETQQSLFRLRLQSETERLEAPSEIIKARREIARIKTILREREINRERATLAALRILPRAFLIPVVRLVSLYFMVTGRVARAASRDYLERYARAYPGDGTGPGVATSYRHFSAFGDAILDRLAAWSGKLRTADIEFESQAEYQRLVDSGRGALLLGSHLGNIEMCRALCSLDRIVRVNALAHTRHAGKINRLLDEAGAADFIVKPFEREFVRRTFEKLANS